MSIDSFLSGIGADTVPAIAAIRAFIKSYDAQYENWYVGGTGDLDDRLFGFHKVDPKVDVFIVVGTQSRIAVKNVEEFFQKSHGCETRTTEGGTPGQGLDDDSTMTYVYRITEKTKQR